MLSNLPAYRPDRSVIVLSHVSHSIMGDVADPTHTSSHQTTTLHDQSTFSFSIHIHGTCFTVFSKSPVEPAVLEPATTSKRKRAQPAEEEVHTEEKENVGKPQSRSRREARQTPSARSKGRTSSRSQATLQDVAESDEGDQAGHR